MRSATSRGGKHLQCDGKERLLTQPQREEGGKDLQPRTKLVPTGGDVIHDSQTRLD